MAFVKGQSGNPGGRPKELTEVIHLARTHTVASVEALARIVNDTAAPPNAVVSAATALLDRAWGKPVQTTEHSGVGGDAIKHTITVSFVAPK